MTETLVLQPALRPVNLVPLEEQEVGLQTTLLEQQQSAETAEQTTFLRKAGALAMKAVGLVEDKITKAAIYTQIKTWDAIETVTGAVEHTKDYLKLQGGRAVAHGALAGLAIAAGAGFMELKDSGTAYAATNDATYQVVDGPYYLHDPNSPPQISSATIGLGQTGDVLTISCHETSDNVSGDAEWDLVTDQNNGLTGFMADYGTNTRVGALAGTAQGHEGAQLTALGIPECGSANPVSAPTPVQTQPTNPDTPNFAQACVDDKGAIALQIVDNALGTVDYQGTGDAIHDNPNAGIQYKSSLEQYDVQWGNTDEPQIVCVGAQMSAPDTVNHRQFIGTVASIAPENGSGCTVGTDIEIWGQGFYKKTHCTDSTVYTINQWLPNGTNVCAAISQESDYTVSDSTGGLKVVGGPLDAADPYRQIACFQIKA